MSLKVRVEDGVGVMDLEGKLTIGGLSDEIREAVRGLIQSGRRDVLVNLAGVTLMDSIGVGALVGAYTSVASRGGRMKFLQPDKRVHHSLSITRLLTVFDVFQDEREAIRSFRHR